MALYYRIVMALAICLSLSACFSFSDEDWRDYVSVADTTGARQDICHIAGEISAQEQQALPHYFITNRLPDCRQSPHIILNQRGDAIRYGRALGYGAGVDGHHADLQFQDSAHWWRDIVQHSQNAGNGDKGRVIIYVHGFNYSFADTMFRVRQIDHYTGFSGPIIAYSWPSLYMISRYGSDQANNVWDRLYLYNFIQNIASREEIDEIILIGHSMGTRSVTDVLADMVTQHPESAQKIKRVILASADMDRQYFEQQLLYHLFDPKHQAGQRHFSLFVSDSDVTLAAAQRLYAYPRLGSTICAHPESAKQGKKCHILAELRAKPAHEWSDMERDIINGVTIFDSSKGYENISYVRHNDYLDSPIARAQLCRAIMAPLPSHHRGNGAEMLVSLPKGDGTSDLGICAGRAADEKPNMSWTKPVMP